MVERLFIRSMRMKMLRPPVRDNMEPRTLFPTIWLKLLPKYRLPSVLGCVTWIHFHLNADLPDSDKSEREGGRKDGDIVVMFAVRHLPAVPTVIKHIY